MTKTEIKYLELNKISRTIYLEKLDLYGVSWKVFRAQTIIDQIYIKIKRIRSIEINKENKVGDNITNDYIAIINYCIIGLIQSKTNYDEAITKDSAILEYDIIFNFAFELLQNKNADYGEAWKEMYIESFTDLMLVKILRIKELFNKKEIEEINFNYYDIMNYAILALIK